MLSGIYGAIQQNEWHHIYTWSNISSTFHIKIHASEKNTMTQNRVLSVRIFWCGLKVNVYFK